MQPNRRQFIQQAGCVDRRAFLGRSLATLAGLTTLRPTQAAEPFTPPNGIIVERYAGVEILPVRVGYHCLRPHLVKPQSVDVVDPHNGKARQLAELPANCVSRSAALSPDGRFLAYNTAATRDQAMTQGKPRTRLCIRDLHTGKVIEQRAPESYRQAARGESFFAFRTLTWRPDGQSLAVSAVRSPDQESIYTKTQPQLGWGPVPASDVLEFTFAPAQMTLTAGAVHANRFAPSFSPDSQHMATQGLPYNNAESAIVVTGRDGKTCTLSDSTHSHQPLWSKTNRLLYYARDMRPIPIKIPEWRPGASKWLFDPETRRYAGPTSKTPSKYTAFDLQLVTDDGKERKVVLPKALTYKMDGPVASWSPDGAKIAIQTPLYPGTAIDPDYHRLQISLIDVDSGVATPIRDTGLIPALPTNVVVWSPHGDQVAFTSPGKDWAPKTPQASDLMTAGVDGGSARRLLEGVVRVIDWR